MKLRRAVMVFFIDCVVHVFVANCEDSFTHMLKRSYNLSDELKQLACDFGRDSGLSLCSWSIPDRSHPEIRWKTGQGALSHWSGGPLNDHTLGTTHGGYAYFETSYKPRKGRIFPSLSWSRVSALLNGDVSERPQQRIIIPLLIKNHILKKTVIIQNLLQETQQLSQAVIQSRTRPQVVPDSALLVSKRLPATRPQGLCLRLYYSLYGLSADRLSLILLDLETHKNRTLIQTFVDIEETWVRMEVAYAHPNKHKLLLEGKTKKGGDPEREYRGYIAIDDISVYPIGSEACYGHCTFEGGLCNWSNQQEGDEFDWKLAKGSDNFYSGPAQDFNIFSKESPPGNFLHIDASFPRRFGDKAIFLSPIFNATAGNSPLCFRFAFHMYGTGIANLTVKIRPQNKTSAEEKVVWTMGGDMGNKWFQGQFPISSSSPFVLAIEGIVGQNRFGNMAIDSVSFEDRFCPTFPEKATDNSGDCTFEESMCFWTNPQHPVDDFDWIRYPYGILGDHWDLSSPNQTITAFDAKFYMSLKGDMLRPNRGGISSWLMSPLMKSHYPAVQCMSLFYYMYQNASEAVGPKLGGLRVLLKSRAEAGNIVVESLWRLNNHQSLKWRNARIPLSFKRGTTREPLKHEYNVVIEGIWGNSGTGMIAIDDISFISGDCTLSPSHAEAVFGECSFDHDLCGWTDSEGAEKQRPGHSNRMATPWKRTAVGEIPNASNNLLDHTFRAENGFVYFENDNRTSSSQKAILLSPLFTTREANATERCLSFWFIGFGERQKSLSVSQANLFSKLGVASKSILWRVDQTFPGIRAKDWTYGQVKLNNEVPFRIQFNGEATTGGFALDDITLYEGTCQTRPPEATL